MDDMFKTVGLMSAVFALTENNSDDREQRNKNVEQRARFYKTAFGKQGLMFPEDWDDLTLEEKEKRINGLDKIAMEAKWTQ